MSTLKEGRSISGGIAPAPATPKPCVRPSGQGTTPMHSSLFVVAPKPRRRKPVGNKEALADSTDPYAYLRELLAAQKVCGSKGAGSRAGELAIEAEKLLSEMTKVRAALTGYYMALDKREHGGVAGIEAFDKIQQAVGMSWK